METSQGFHPGGECCGGGWQGWVRLYMFVLLGRFMAPCHCTPTILYQKKKKTAYKAKYEPEDIWILFLSRK